MNKMGVFGLKAVLACFVLSACSTSPSDVLSKMGLDGSDGASAEAASQETASALDPNHATGETSNIITDLMARRSVLNAGSFSKVSDAVLAANSRAAEAELRAAKLREEARANNWLPTLGPSVSLTSLGDVVTSLVLEQVLFDNGRKKAERDYAAADVDVAAVTLAEDSNKRVLSALELYLTQQQSSALARVNEKALKQMARYEYVMSERVRGGVSGRVDLQIVTQKVNQMRSDLSSDREAGTSALSELNAMSNLSLAGVSGLSSVAPLTRAETPLAVLKAEAEAGRLVAEAKAARAGFLPGLSLSGSAGSNGKSGALNVTSDKGLGFGTGASLAALDQQTQFAQAQVAQKQEDTERVLRSLEGKLASLRRQEREAQSLAKQAAANYDVYSQQQEAGHRTVPDVVSIFETKVAAERKATALKYDVVLVQLKLAALMGVLVNGEQI